MKMDKQEMQYRPQVYQGRKRGQYNHEKVATIIETDCAMEIDINHIEAEEITIAISIDQIIG